MFSFVCVHIVEWMFTNIVFHPTLLQRVLVYLPELIHKKWQYNSICEGVPYVCVHRHMCVCGREIKPVQCYCRSLLLVLYTIPSSQGWASSVLFNFHLLVLLYFYMDL